MKKNSFKSSRVSVSSRLVQAGSVMCVMVLCASCTNETARRSAVDPKRLCDPANPYSCLSTESSPSSTNPNPQPAPTRKAEGAPPVTDGSGDGGAPPEAPASDTPVVSPAAPAAPVDDADARARAQAEALKNLNESLGEIGKAIGDNIRKPPDSSSSSSDRDPGSANPSAYTVTFSKDSFVGIATGSVKQNCFVTSGTVIEVKTAPVKITEFASQGVNQLLARDVASVSPAGGVSGCTLTGQDFVYMATHADAQPKP